METKTLRSLALEVLERNKAINKCETRTLNFVSHDFNCSDAKETNLLLLEQYEERAAIMEYDGGLSREYAEKQALTDLNYIRSNKHD